MLKSAFHATGTVFYVIEGSGHSKGAGTSFDWSAGDAFVFPGGISTHHQAGPGGAVLYCADDEPTLRFYRVRPDSSAVAPILYSKADIDRQFEKVQVREHPPDEAGKAVFLTHVQGPDYGTVPPQRVVESHTLAARGP